MAKKKVDWLSGLGLSAVAYAHVVICYLPNKDKDGRAFDVEPWETEALKLQGRLFRGATSYPSRGSYRTSDAQGRVEAHVQLEATRMVVSFVQEEDYTSEGVGQVVDFLRRFKRRTRQDAAGLVLDGELYYL